MHPTFPGENPSHTAWWRAQPTAAHLTSPQLIDDAFFNGELGPRIESRAAAKAALAFLRAESSHRGQWWNPRIAILEWANRWGRRINRFPYPLDGPGDRGNGEHHAFYHLGSRRWIKLTRGTGARGFGKTLRIDPAEGHWGFGPATASQYLERLILANRVFDDDIRFHGAYADEEGRVGLMTSQPDIRGEVTDPDWIRQEMSKAGFVRVRAYRGTYMSWYRRRDNLLVLDLHEGNVVNAHGKLAVIDAILLHPTGPELAVVTEGLYTDEPRAEIEWLPLPA